MLERQQSEDDLKVLKFSQNIHSREGKDVTVPPFIRIRSIVNHNLWLNRGILMFRFASIDSITCIIRARCWQKLLCSSESMNHHQPGGRTADSDRLELKDLLRILKLRNISDYIAHVLNY